MGRRDDYTPGTPCWVDLTTPDVDAAAAFYGDVFGWTVREVMPGAYAYFERDGDPVAGLAPLGEEQRAAGMPPSWSMYVSVEDADDAVARAESLGGTVAVAPLAIEGAGRMAAVADPGGGVVLLWEPGGFPGAAVVNEVGAWALDDLQTTDPEGATPFYEALFGWSVSAIPGAGDAYYSIAHEGRGIGGIMRATRGIQQPYWTVYFGVDDVVTTLDRIASLGGRTLVEPTSVPSGRFAVAMDPQGAVLCVLEGDYDD
ncbi:MAG TPA: VOC family protein [Baekduia sp.]|nr:VOC family protein [Baekduia sp.]